LFDVHLKLGVVVLKVKHSVVDVGYFPNKATKAVEVVTQ
jgi:hypothetical protein